MKRTFDVILSAAALVVLSPLFIAAAILIRLDSKGPVFFRQERIGRNFRAFRIFKFRSMSADTGRPGPLVTVRGDARVTRAGRLLRKTKIDELPQLLNVLMGDMSLVGPRPEVKKYVEMFRGDYEKLLSVRPGITDPASLRFADEETVLSLSADWEDAYVKDILPEKIRLAKSYVENPSLAEDVRMIARTLLRIGRQRGG